MFVVAVTGGIGSGKSTVCQIFSKLGVGIVDADDVAAELLEPKTPVIYRIAERFGADIAPDGILDRKKLRERIFSNPGEKDWLNNLLHPLIRQNMQHRIAKMHGPYCIAIVPLLFENSLTSQYNRVLVIDCPKILQIDRASVRDNVSPVDIQRIIDAQIAPEKRIEAADDVIVNDGSLEELYAKTYALHEKYMTLAKDWNKP